MTITLPTRERAHRSLRQVDPATGLRHGVIRHPHGSVPNLDGCRWCGVPYFGHNGTRWAASHGMHEWEPPTEAQTIARQTARGRLAIEAAARRPACCKAMNHNSVGGEVFCEIEDPDHTEDHDAGDGITWARED